MSSCSSHVTRREVHLEYIKSALTFSAEISLEVLAEREKAEFPAHLALQVILLAYIVGNQRALHSGCLTTRCCKPREWDTRLSVLCM